uniref:separase n=1 Tax=Saccoglossus kowalevskii TaxID=10224 RepID=A0ABM0MHE1_SACKO|nr:PREDICTED: uncharacterized protein LOC102810216 [Saccoglossus kowalevskii]
MLFQKSLVLLQIEAQKNGCSVQELLANVWKIKTQQSANTEEEDDLDAITKKLEECSINGTDPNTKMKNKVKMMKKTEKLTSKKSIKILDDARDTMATGGDTELDGEPNTVLKLSSFDIGRLEMLTQSAKKISSSSRQNAARAQGSKTLHQYVSENEDFIEYSPTKIIVEHNGSTEYDFQTTDETKPKKKTRAKTRKKMIEYSASDSENTETCENEKQDQMKRRPTRCKVKPRNNDTYEHLDLENKAVKMTSKQRNVARSCKVVIDIHKDEVEKDKCSGGRSRRNARGGSKDMKESSRNTRKGKTLKEVCYEDEDEMLHDGKDVYDLSDSESDEAWQPENKKQTRRRNTKSSKKSLEVEDNRVTVERSMPARRGRPRKNVTKEEIVLEVPKEKRKGRVRATRTENVERVRDEGGHGNDDYHDEEDEVLDLSMDDFNRNSSGLESPQLCTSLHRKKLPCINIENELSQVLLTGLQGCYLSDTNDLQLCPLDNDADDEIDEIELVRGNDSDIEADNHLILPRKRTSKCRQLNSAAMTSHVDLSAIIDLLKTAYTLCLSTVPMKLFRDICHTLVKCTGDSQPYQSVYYLQQSSAVTLRHQKLANIYKKLRKLKKERSDPKKITRLEEENQCFVWKEKDIDASIDETVQCLPPDTNHYLRKKLSQFKFFTFGYFCPDLLNESADYAQDCFGDILRDISDQFRQIQVENKNMKETNKKKWWKIREDLNTRLKALLSNMENELLGCWKVLLLGRSEDEQIAKHITMVTAKFTKLYKLEAMQSQLLQYLLHGMTWLDRYHIMSGLSAVTGIPMNSDELNTMCNEILTLRDEIDAKFEMKSIKRCPVILVLDKHVQQLPWESLSIINASKQSISRMPSIQFILSHLQERSNEHSVLSHGVNPSKTSYVVNPSGDLANTQKAFEDWFKKVEGWSGISGRIPTSDEYKAALLNNDLFIYCGHGNGGQYLSGDDILRLQCNSVSLLMGCSSGQLDTNNSDMEATGMVLNYLLAGW